MELSLPRPWARSAVRLLPKKLQRSLLLARGVNRPYAHFPNLASRRCLESELLPWVRDSCRSILFVGTAPYTWHYEKLFPADRYVTLDIAPSAAVWGAQRHIVAAVQDLTRHRPNGFFDAVVLNGVLGFGVDTQQQIRRVFEELHRALPPNGLLVVGWNTDRLDDPEALGICDGRFARLSPSPWAERRCFLSETHVYDVYRRLADQ